MLRKGKQFLLPLGIFVSHSVFKDAIIFKTFGQQGQILIW
jgi:hypothetical protein